MTLLILQCLLAGTHGTHGTNSTLGTHTHGTHGTDGTLGTHTHGTHGTDGTLGTHTPEPTPPQTETDSTSATGMHEHIALSIVQASSNQEISNCPLGYNSTILHTLNSRCTLRNFAL